MKIKFIITFYLTLLCCSVFGQGITSTGFSSVYPSEYIQVGTDFNLYGNGFQFMQANTPLSQAQINALYGTFDVFGSSQSATNGYNVTATNISKSVVANLNAITNGGNANLNTIASQPTSGNAYINVSSASSSTPHGYSWGYAGNTAVDSIFSWYVNGKYAFFMQQNGTAIADYGYSSSGWTFDGPGINALQPSKLNAGAENSYHPDGSIWQAMTRAPIAFIVSDFTNNNAAYGTSAITNAAQILTEITNQFIATGFAAAMASNGTPGIVWNDAVGILTMSPSGVTSWNTNFAANITNNYIIPIHNIGWKVALGSYFNGDVFNIAPTVSTYVCPFNGGSYSLATYATIGNPNTYFQGGLVSSPVSPVLTPYELPAYENTLYSWGVDSASYNDLSMSIAGFHSFENSACYFSLFPPPSNSAWTYNYPDRLPLSLEFYETSYWRNNEQNSAVDTAVSKNIIEFDQGAQPRFGTNVNTASVSVLRLLANEFPNVKTTSQGLYCYMNEASGYNFSHITYVSTAIASEIPRIFIPQANSNSYAGFWSLTNSTWASSQGDPLQAFPTLFSLGLNIGSIWVKPLCDGNTAAGIFNESTTLSTNITVAWQQLGIPTNTTVLVTDLDGPTPVSLGYFQNSFSTNMAATSACLLKFTVANYVSLAGFASSATNTTTFSASGITNNTGVNLTVVGFTGTSVYFTNLATHANYPLGTITVPSDKIIQNNCALIGSSCACSTNVGF